MKNVNVNTRKNGPEPVQEVTEDMWRNFRIKVFIKRSVGFFTEIQISFLITFYMALPKTCLCGTLYRHSDTLLRHPCF